jgi:4'-phosphopantetheinyl transferase
MSIFDQLRGLSESAFQLQPGEVHVWRISLEEARQHLEEFRQLLSEDERLRALRFRFPQPAEAFTTSRGMLRMMLGKYLNLPPEAVEIEYEEKGKPVVNAPISFNITHSADEMLMAFCRDRMVGIDLEQLRPMPDLHSIAQRFFSELENRLLQSLPNDSRIEAFFNCWTRKEAYLKAVGDGFTQPSDKFSVSLIPDDPPQLIDVEGKPYEPARWSFEVFRPLQDYVAAIAVEGQKNWQILYRQLTGAVDVATQHLPR